MAAINEVTAALEAQISAWNAGDLEKAMTFYWNSPEVLWINKSGIDKGYQPVLDMFLEEFKDRSKMGYYSYQPLFIEELAPGLVYFVFDWKIELEGVKIMGCISSQVWKKTDAQWVVRAEHAG